MTVYRLQCSMIVPATLGEVFGFFEDPRNLGRITPSWLNFRIVNPDGVEMREGAEIDYVIRWQGVPMKWQTRIVSYDPPRSFIDEQMRGPYRFWRHTHSFAECAEGVAVSDCVDYRLPFGVFGRLAHAAIVQRQLIEIFRFRQSAIAAVLGGVSFDAPRVT
jgi:ligand-binding SRPBCC domain-containing protein